MTFHSYTHTQRLERHTFTDVHREREKKRKKKSENANENENENENKKITTLACVVRQFLFRTEHINKFKSECAAIVARQVRFCHPSLS